VPTELRNERNGNQFREKASFARRTQRSRRILKDRFRTEHTERGAKDLGAREKANPSLFRSSAEPVARGTRPAVNGYPVRAARSAQGKGMGPMGRMGPIRQFSSPRPPSSPRETCLPHSVHSVIRAAPLFPAPCPPCEISPCFPRAPGTSLKTTRPFYPAAYRGIFLYENESPRERRLDREL